MCRLCHWGSYFHGVGWIQHKNIYCSEMSIWNNQNLKLNIYCIISLHSSIHNVPWKTLITLNLTTWIFLIFSGLEKKKKLSKSHSQPFSNNFSREIFWNREVGNDDLSEFQIHTHTRSRATLLISLCHISWVQPQFSKSVSLHRYSPVLWQKLCQAIGIQMWSMFLESSASSARDRLINSQRQCILINPTWISP